MKRRRFLCLAAAFGAAPLSARSGTGVRWSGRAFGADVRLQGAGPAAQADRVLNELPDLLKRIEATFSLYDPASELSELNRTGQLRDPSPWMRQLLDVADRAHRLTGGLFDPTVQPLWQALAAGGDVAGARALVGWSRVARDGSVRLGAGQALPLNGLAPGFAPDLVLARLRARGARIRDHERIYRDPLFTGCDRDGECWEGHRGFTVLHRARAPSPSRWRIHGLRLGGERDGRHRPNRPTRPDRVGDARAFSVSRSAP